MHWIDEIDLRLKKNWEEQMFLWYQETSDKERVDEKAREVRELLLDPNLLDKTEALLKREKNPISKRKAEILRKEIVKARIEYDKRLFALRSEIEERADKFLPLINGKEGKKTLQLALAAKESAKSGRVLKL